MPEIHAKLSASISKRWMKCHGSILLGLKFPQEQGTNDAADLGTAVHYICEWGLNNAEHPSEFLNHHPKPYISVGTAPNINKIEVTDKMLEDAGLYCETIWNDIAELEEEHLDEGNLYVEESVSINNIFELGDLAKAAAFADENNILDLTEIELDALYDQDSNPEEFYKLFISELFNMFGTNDASFIIPGSVLYIYDYKNGRWGVDVENNTQFLYYALGTAFKYDWNFEEVVMTVVQPNDIHNEEKIRRWKITKEELQSWVPKFRQAALNVIYEWKKYSPDKDICHYCPASGACKAEANLRTEQCKADFDDGVLKELPLGSLTYEEMGLILNNADAIKSFVDNVCKMAKSLINDGDDQAKTIFKKKLVYGSTRRVYSKTESEIKTYLSEDLLLDESEYVAPGKLLPITKLQKLIGKEEMKNLTTMSEPSIIMVDIDDDREEIGPSKVNDFKDV